MSASTPATNGFVTLKMPCSRTAFSPWYQAASASRSPAEVSEQMLEVEHAGLDVAVERPRERVTHEYLLDEVARHRKRL